MNEIKELQKKIAVIGMKYTELSEKRIQQAIDKDNITVNDLQEIGDSVRILNHVAGALLKLHDCNLEVAQSQSSNAWESF